MARKDNENKLPAVQPLRVLAQLFLVGAFLLLLIGDTVLFAVKGVFSGILMTYKSIRAFTAWIYARLVSFPKRILPRPMVLRLPEIPRPSFPLSRIRSLPLPALPLYPVIYFFLGIVFTLLFIFLPYAAYTWLRMLPNPKLLTNRDIEVTTKIYDRNGILLYDIYADQNRTPLPLSEIPELLRYATVAIEDKDFYSHQGFSPRGILRAAREFFLNHQVQGGSTITQQLIKSALLTPEVTVSRKIKEIVLAFWAERLFSKNQILEMYLNQVPYGGTAWGAETASQTYFGKPVKSLSLAESALLAGLPAAPTEYSPFGNHPQKAFERQGEVLRRMVEDGYITSTQAQEALSQEISFTKPHIGIRAPHFVMYVKELLENHYGPRLVERGGLRIKTSLDIDLEERLEDVVKTHINALKPFRVGNGAALVTNPKTGEILAMVGSHDYFDATYEGNVNVTTSLRPPGSSIKVVTYAAALERGFTAATILNDSPVVYTTPGSPAYAPVNYDGRFHGLVPLRYALGNSYNVPAVKTIAAVGVATVIEEGKRMGISSWTDESRYGLSLTLGGGDVTMLDMARVYGTLANLGTEVELAPILEVTDYRGHVIERSKPKGTQGAVKPEVAWIIGNILSDNNARTAAFGPGSLLVIPGKTVSVKTGTSNDKRDNWTIGYTPSYVAAVWVGNNDNTPMDPLLTSGVTGAAPIWHDIMTLLLQNKLDEVPPRPPAVIAIPCYFGREEFFIKGTEPPGGRCVPLPSPTGSSTPTP